MFYENTAQDIDNNNNESIQNESNIYQKEIKLPEDLSNSQITDEEKENEKKEEPINNQIKILQNEKNKNMTNKKLNNNKKDIKSIKNYTGRKTKKKYVDYISETHSKNSDLYINNSENGSDIKDIITKEKNIINNNNEDNENDEEEEKEENDNNEENEEIEKDEKNKIIATSDELAYPYKNKFEKNITNKKKNKEIKQIKQNLNLNEIDINNNYNKKSKKVQKLEKILKENILNSGNNRINQKEIYEDNYDENEKYNSKYNYIKHQTINNINDYPSLTPLIKNNRNNKIQNNNISTRNSNIEENNNIQRYFKLNAQTPNRLKVNGYEYLVKKRSYTPKIQEINRNIIPGQNKIINDYINRTSMDGFSKNNMNNNNDNKAHETLEIVLQDMEQHLQNMALNQNILNNANYNSRTNREESFKENNKYYNNDIHINNNFIDKKTKNHSLISNGNGYLVEEQKNLNTNNNNYFSNYKNEAKLNFQNLNINNDDDSIQINKRIDNLEKNIFEIKDELNNISSNLKMFLNKENFLYNFKDSIKQICYDFFNERLNNNNNNELNINEINNNDFDNNEQIKNENENDEEINNSQYSGEYSENKNNQNEHKIEEEINKKIDEKLEYLCDNLKNQIFEKYLQPSINEIEKSMRQNIEDIKEKVDSINNTNITSNSIRKTNNKYYNNILNEEDDNNFKFNNYDGYSIDLKSKNNEQNSKGDIYNRTSSKIRREKYEEINRLGEKLYDKLLEKEKKLKLLKQEANLSMSRRSLINNNNINDEKNY